jgi:hypothetical protein
MKEREFKKLVFENFVQAKKELIREGYIKRSDNLNFEDVFSETKKRVLEERVKSLQRENQMLKKQIKRKGLREAGEDSSGGKLGAKFQQGSKALDGVFDFIDDVLAKYGNMGSKISVIKRAMKAKKVIESDRDLNQFGMKLQTKLEDGLPMKKAILSALRQMGIRTPEIQTLAENRRRRY